MEHGKNVTMEIVREADARDIELPAYQSNAAAGMDVRAAVKETLTLLPGQIALVPTGLKIAVPMGFEVQVRPRSGLALKHGIIVVNSPGTIDADYRGPVGIILGNLGKEPLEIKRGDRIAQLVVAAVSHCEIKEVGELSSTERGAGGFGSTGV